MKLQSPQLSAKVYQMERPLPSSPDLERFVLAAILIEPDRLESVTLEPDDLSVDVNKRIWRAIVDCANDGYKPDRATVAARLEDAGELENVGGVTYLVGLEDGMPKALNLDGWIRKIKEKSALRKAIWAGTHLSNRALLEDGTAAEILADHAERIAKLSQNGAGGHSEIQSPTDLIGSWERNYVNVAEIEWIIPGMVSRGTTAMFSGVPGCGKSTLACALAWKYKCAGGRVLILDLENEPATVKERFKRMGIEVGPDFLYWGRAMEQPPCKPGAKFVRDLILADPRPLLVIVDSFAAFGSAMDAEWNENDAGQVTRFFASFQDLAARDRGTFLVIHHNNREDDFRGSSAIPANIDTGYMVKNLDRSGGTKLDMMTVTPSIKTRRLSDRTTFFYDEGKMNCDPGPLASERADQIKFVALLTDNPGVSTRQFIKLATAAGMGRNEAVKFLEIGVKFGSIRTEVGLRNSIRHYLKSSVPPECPGGTVVGHSWDSAGQSSTDTLNGTE